MGNYQEKRYFDNIQSNKCTVKSAKSQVLDMIAVVDKYDGETGLTGLSYQDLNELLFKSEQMALKIRKTLNEKSRKDVTLFAENNIGNVVETDEILRKNHDKIQQKIDEITFKNYPVNCNFDGRLFQLFTPLTFKRGYKKGNFFDNYALADYVENALLQWQNSHEISLYKTIKAPYFIVMKRTDIEFRIDKICDADNIENQRIINAVTRGFSMPDNQQFCSLISMFDEVDSKDEAGTWFYIFSEDDLEMYLDLLRKRDKGHVKSTFHQTIKL